jgi:hypothetical protein
VRKEVKEGCLILEVFRAGSSELEEPSLSLSLFRHCLSLVIFVTVIVVVLVVVVIVATRPDAESKKLGTRLVWATSTGDPNFATVGDPTNFQLCGL